MLIAEDIDSDLKNTHAKTEHRNVIKIEKKSHTRLLMFGNI
jgi:hypothetical protein